MIMHFQLLTWACSPKLFPWFVSDVTPSDFADLFDSLLSPTFFLNTESVLFSPENQDHLTTMVNRWKLYLASGTFALSVPEDTQLGAKNVMADFWTEPWPYWDMKGRAGELFRWLSSSQLVIFKVSTEYREMLPFCCLNHRP
jgi:damage-control phosphatase, subfamily III